MKIGIIGNTTKPSAKPAINNFVKLLKSRNIEYCYDKALQNFLTLSSKDVVLSLHQFAGDVDVAVAFGGDGTILQAASSLGSGVPILGVNIGSLGFLAEVLLDELEIALNELLSGDYQVSKRMLLKVKIIRRNSVNEYFALNDVVIDKKRGSRLIIIDTFVNSTFLNSYRADGLIVSTPTGATAYSMSAGGPILQPSMDAFIITPICPHSLTVRPIVVSSDSKIEMSIPYKADPVQVVIDGQPACPLTEADKVCVEKAAFTVDLVCNRNKDFFKIIRKKLNWGTDIPGYKNKGNLE